MPSLLPSSPPPPPPPLTTGAMDARLQTASGGVAPPPPGDRRDDPRDLRDLRDPRRDSGTFDPPQRQSISRRPSGASVRSQGASVHSHGPSTHHGSALAYNASSAPPHSPASVSSSSAHPWSQPPRSDYARSDYDNPRQQQQQQQPPQHAWTHSPQSTTVGLPGTAGPPPSRPRPQSIQPQPLHHTQLPRIATPLNDDDEHVGPRSAPASSPLAGPAPPYAQPPRSSSSPDPRSAPPSQATSPIGRPAGAGYFPVHPGPPSVHDASHHIHQQQGGYGKPRAAFMSNLPSSSSHASSEQGGTRRSETPTSMSSAHGPAGSTISAVSSQPIKRSGSVTYCAKCGLAVRGQFVRALHQVYHLDCFRCKDCDKVVAQKFFPIEDGDAQYPLCERDYFARLDLICAKCDRALRSSYITACGEKFHVEHFSCSVCATVFGPSDSYYEHNGRVYCHYHYSISFANKCVGCETAILKQFVEINRNGRDECWHPECYMIHKFWNVRLASRNFTTPAATTPVTSSVSLLEMSSLSMSGSNPTMSPTVPTQSTGSPGWGSETTPDELKERQITMELKVSQIWLVLSGFEESSAACIGDMLRVVNERKLLDVILLAEKFILHVETLFAVIDDLEAQFALAGVKGWYHQSYPLTAGMSHAREAKQLCRKLVNFFSMLSQISPHGGAIPNMQELLTQVTQLAHYLKILIRIALTGAIKLDREQGNPHAMMNALARLHLLSLDNADPSLTKRGDHPAPPQPTSPWTGNETPEEMAQRSFDSLTRHPGGFIASTTGIAYGYKSLAVEATGETTLRGPQDDRFVPNDGCAHCNGAIEDDCIRQGMFNRWHSACVECKQCGDKASVSRDPADGSPLARTITDDDSHEGHAPALHKTIARRKPSRVADFLYEPPKIQYAPAEVIWCNLHRTATAVNGFQPVSRLEQFAFLLHVALRRLYLHFREHHGIQSALTRTEVDSDIKRVKSVTLDRKLSSTARLPQRSTVVESPAGKMADENGQVTTLRDTPPVIIPPDSEQGPKSATVDVIRPPFARNNTQVRIVSESNATEGGSPEPPSRSATLMVPGRRNQEDDVITLSDIPMLTGRSPRPMDSVPLMASLSPLQSLIVRHFALLQVQKTGIGHLVELDEVIELLDSRKNQWWNKIFKGTAKKDQKRKGVFGVPIEMLIERTGSDSQLGCDPNVQLRVPEFIEEIISTMRQQDMAIEGIFRKNGNIRKLQAIAEALDKDSASVVLADENPVQLAALLKRFLREMPDPLLTFRLHKLFCAAAMLPNPEDKKRTLHLLVTLLPKPNRDILEVLFVFLRWVASFSYRDEETGSRMDLANLATVICPSILYAKGQNAARDESFIAIQAVQSLLEFQDDIYHIPAELLFVIHENVHSIFTKDIDLPPKEIHKHCVKYLQARHMPQHRDRDRQGNLGPGGGPHRGASGSEQRPPDLRLAGYKSDNGQGRERERDPRDRDRDPRDREGADRGGRDPLRDDSMNQLRAAVSPANNSRPVSWGGGPGGPGSGTPRTGTPTGGTSNTSGLIAMPMPTPHVNGTPMTSPTFPPHASSAGHGAPGPVGPGSGLQQPMPSLPSPGWRGPFQGAGTSGASNGSRNSSRGSAPPSPGINEAERRSFQMERDASRDRSWTPNEMRHGA